MLEKIIRIAQEFCEDEDVEWNEDTSILSDMELTSMEMFSFIAKVEGELNIKINERQLGRIGTLGDLVRLAEKG